MQQATRVSSNIMAKGQLSKQAKRRYITEGSADCPYCHEHIGTGYGTIDIVGSYAVLHVSCRACSRNWKDYYELVDMREVIP